MFAALENPFDYCEKHHIWYPCTIPSSLPLVVIRRAYNDLCGQLKDLINIINGLPTPPPAECPQINFKSSVALDSESGSDSDDGLNKVMEELFRAAQSLKVYRMHLL